MPVLVLIGKDQNLNIVHTKNLIVVSVSKEKHWACYKRLLRLFFPSVP